MSEASLRELFAPTSVAVVGASNRVDSVAGALFRNLLRAGYRGTAYPVNPRWKSVSGVRCYGTVDELPETPELGVIIVPAPLVAAATEALGRRGTRGIVVISSGFREVGGEGETLEAGVIAVARRYGISLVGPNCFGLLNTDPEVGLNATFSGDLPPRGNIAFVSQSGALCAGILKYGIAERIGFSRFISVGNRAGVDENDLLRSLGDDDATQVILIYIESLADGRRFLDTAREVTERKPVLIIKSGRSPAGERAARSHTGSLAASGRDRLFDAIFEQCGVLRAETIGELFRTAKIFASGVRLGGPQLTVLTNSGGPGIVAADAAARSGLELPVPEAGLQAELRRLLPSSASVGNPVDMTADAKPEQYREALQRILASPTTNGAVVIATPTGTLTGIAAARAILEARAGSSKAVVACLFGLNDLTEEVAELEHHGVPTFTFPEEAVAGLGSLARYSAWKTRPRTEVRHFDVDIAAARRVIAAARSAGATVLPEYAARGLLEAYGIPFARSRRVRTADEAAAAADALGYPVALKVASPAISHKTDVGGVALGLESVAAVRTALATMERTLAAKAPGAPIEGFEVEEMVSGGKEVLLGLQRDPAFGPVVVFGMGGIYVEVLQDVTFRLAPLRPLSARHMVQSVRTHRILEGVRGEPPSDVEALCEAIERISQMAVELPEVVELDVNPLIVRAAGRGLRAVDARAVLAPTSRSAPAS